MNQKEFCKSTKHELIVTILSAFASFPIKESHLQFITSCDLRYGYTSLLGPLAFGKYQNLISTICFNALPGGNTDTIAINLSRYSRKYLIL